VSRPVVFLCHKVSRVEEKDRPSEMKFVVLVMFYRRYGEIHKITDRVNNNSDQNIKDIEIKSPAPSLLCNRPSTSNQH
jgi:hypothetical protein